MRVKITTDGTVAGTTVTNVDTNEVLDHICAIALNECEFPGTNGKPSIPARIILKREIEVEVVGFEQRAESEQQQQLPVPVLTPEAQQQQ
jgi:hypothetical protein